MSICGIFNRFQVTKNACEIQSEKVADVGSQSFLFSLFLIEGTSPIKSNLSLKYFLLFWQAACLPGLNQVFVQREAIAVSTIAHISVRRRWKEEKHNPPA